MRKSIFVNIIENGKPMTFKVTAMPALKQERWLNRVIMLLVGKNATSLASIKGIIEHQEYGKLLTLFQGISYDDVEPLYNELLECCEHCPNPQNRNITVPCSVETIDGVIQDFRNLYALRMKALEVCFDFFKPGEQSQVPEKQAQIVIGKNM